MNILIIEDDEIWQYKIRTMLAEFEANISVADSIKVAQNTLRSVVPDIVISDVVLTDGESFTFFMGLKRSYPIVFVTNYPKEFYLQQSLGLDNAHFLIKPFHALTLQGLVKKLLPQPSDPEKQKGIYVWGKYKQKILIPFERVIYIKSDRNYTEIYTKERTFTQKVSIGKLKHELNEHFVQIHRCFIVNIHFVQRVDITNKSVVVNSDFLPLGRSYKSTFIQKLTEIRGE